MLLPFSPTCCTKRAVHIRTARFESHVGGNSNNNEEQLSRSRFSFAWSVCTGKLARSCGGHGQRQGGGGRHTRCGIPTDDNAGCASVRPSEGLRFPRIPTVFLLKRKEDVRFESHVGESGWSGEGKLSRASRLVFLSRKKRKDPPGARSAFCRPCGRTAGSSRAQTAPQWETRTRSRRANGRSRTARTPQGPAPRADG